VAHPATRFAPRTAACARIRLLAWQSQAAPQARTTGAAGDDQSPSTRLQAGDVLPTLPAANAKRVDDFAAQTRWIKKDQQINAICGPSNAKQAGDSTNKEQIKHPKPLHPLACLGNRAKQKTVRHNGARPAFAQTGKASA